MNTILLKNSPFYRNLSRDLNRVEIFIDSNLYRKTILAHNIIEDKLYLQLERVIEDQIQFLFRTKKQ